MLNTKRIEQIINDLSEVITEKGLEISNEVLFSEACSFERGFLINDSKLPKNFMSNNQQSSVGKQFEEVPAKPRYETSHAPADLNLPATANQISYLRKQGVKINPNLTKQEAFIMISNYKKSLQKENI